MQPEDARERRIVTILFARPGRLHDLLGEVRRGGPRGHPGPLLRNGARNDRALRARLAVVHKMEQIGADLGLEDDILCGRLAAARGDTHAAAEAARAALAEFREPAMPWWMAKAIRLLERAGAADDELLSEVTGIEWRPGAIRPTA